MPFVTLSVAYAYQNLLKIEDLSKERTKCPDFVHNFWIDSCFRSVCR